MEKFYCRICGYRLGFEPWGDDGKTPTYEICPCCGVEFGNEDWKSHTNLTHPGKVF